MSTERKLFWALAFLALAAVFTVQVLRSVRVVFVIAPEVLALPGIDRASTFPLAPKRAAHAPARAGATAASKIGVHSGAAAREGVGATSACGSACTRFDREVEIKTPARGFLAGDARRENFTGGTHRG